MGHLSTHVLDATHGCPGRGIEVRVYRVEGEALHQLTSAKTNDDGRCAGPLLEGEAFRAGVYQLHFAIGDYYRSRGLCLPAPAFLDVAVLRFGVADGGQNYHVPLLVSPYSYSTYRGS
ncbi:5-hydroxyisourate hydrolase [Pseudomonas flavescens]|uniref:5-hydroxyisourate hydrolase n=1 Tax=Phytopseudomonas flavescens TaxID=29435 RepID=A0A1G8J224_9GAMM|nr:hydroxyisourate hydrolase [Pseudomonas flavescens]SDI24720.1 5-hydroxyisourate hydrolase [Pseudomonas flavescens]